MDNISIVLVLLVILVLAVLSRRYYEKFSPSCSCVSQCQCGQAVASTCKCGKMVKNCGKESCDCPCVYKKSKPTGCFGCNSTPTGKYISKEMCQEKYFKPCCGYPDMYSNNSTNPFDWGPTYSVGPYPKAYAFRRTPEI